MKPISSGKPARVTAAKKIAAVSFAALLSFSAPAMAAVFPSTPAINSDSLVESLGVNTHMMNMWFGNAYTDVAAIENDFRYIGFRYARDCFCDQYGNASVLKVNRDVGVRYNMWVYGGIYDKAMAAVKANPSVVTEVEGANEADLFSQAFGSLTGLPAAVAEQKQMWADVKTSPGLSGVKVASFTLTKHSNIAVTGNVGAFADYASSHVYPQWGGMAGEVPSSYMQLFLANQAGLATGKQPVITEGGWWTKPHPQGVTEAVHAKLTLNFVLDAFQQGVARTYLYEMVDEYADPLGLDIEKHFGLFRYDGTPKPAAVALHNLTSLLSDPGTSFTPGSLSYHVSNLPASAHQLLMQRSDGTFVLILWNEPRIWDNAKMIEKTAGATQIWLALSKQASAVTVYDPTVGLKPTQNMARIAGLTMTLRDHPLLVFIKP